MGKKVNEDMFTHRDQLTDRDVENSFPGFLTIQDFGGSVPAHYLRFNPRH